MSGVELETYEGFFSLPDTTSAEASRKSLVLSLDKSRAQIFKAKSTTMKYLFFLAKFEEETDMAQMTVTLHNSDTNYAIGSAVGTPTVVSSAMKMSLKDTNDLSDVFWYRWELDAALTLDDYYAIVFTVSGTATPTLYFTDKYRSGVFPQVHSTSVFADQDWSNDNFTEGAGTGVKVGAICSGFVGNAVSTSQTMDSGNLVLGGGNTSRGYATYMYVRKGTNSTDFKIKLSTANDSGSAFHAEESYVSLMSWYYFKPGTLPSVNDSELFTHSESSINVEDSADFILYTQPDRFPPYF